MCVYINLFIYVFYIYVLILPNSQLLVRHLVSLCYSCGHIVLSWRSLSLDFRLFVWPVTLAYWWVHKILSAPSLFSFLVSERSLVSDLLAHTYSLSLCVMCGYIHMSSVQLLSRVWFFVFLWTVACQTSLSSTNSQNLLKLRSIESVMPTNHLILCYPLLLLPSIFPDIRVFSNKSALCMRWPKYWRFSFSISPSNEHPGLISLGWTGCISLQY